MKKRLTKRGFTLIEALVAVTILALSVAGPMYAANRSLVAAAIARDKLTASYLAQEGIEYVRYMRDNYYLNDYYNGGVTTGSFNAFRVQIESLCLKSIRPCTVDTFNASTPLVSCSGTPPTCAVLKRDASNRYTQGAGTATIFTRKIEVVRTTDTDEEIISTVSWSYRGTTYPVTITDHLTPWQ